MNGGRHAALEAQLAAGRKPRAFDRDWLDVASLPALRGDDGRPLLRATLDWLLTVQHKHKTIDAADEVAPWLDALQPDAARAFALEVLRRWLDSPQDAKERFALTLAGLFGGDDAIGMLLPRVQGWIDGNRYKLAEFAADAIARIGSDAAFCALDTLRNRYRRRFRNVGAAAERAFAAAAAVRGMSTDELGDLVMPRLDFDQHGQRTLSWPGGGVLVELLADGKLAFHGTGDQEDKTWKKLPAAAPAEVAATVKALQKELREVLKAQALRHEHALVQQRRWPRQRWQQLYLDHPVARLFASQLVSGVYAADGTLRRCLRRYANGILADAAGKLDELPEPDITLGFVHPLELAAPQLDAWRQHFARNKLSQPFAQLERPTATLESAHHNRRVLDVTQGKTLSAGTFRGRAERLGWQRGSVIDAGGVTNYWKAFAERGVEAELDLDGFYVGIDPIEQITLGQARFVRAGTVQRGSYVYDEVAGDDARQLRFGEVPPVIWSEVVGDLRTIVGGNS